MAPLGLVGLGLVVGFDDARVLSGSFKISVEVGSETQWAVPTDMREWYAKRPALNGEPANSTAFKLKLKAGNATEVGAEFVYEGPKTNCIIWKVGDGQKLALNSFAWGTFAKNTPMSLWNEEPAPAVEAHSRFTIEDDGRISPNVTGTYVDRLQGRYILGLDRGVAVLVERGPFPAGVTPPYFLKANFSALSEALGAL